MPFCLLRNGSGGQGHSPALPGLGAPSSDLGAALCSRREGSVCSMGVPELSGQDSLEGGRRRQANAAIRLWTYGHMTIFWNI